MSNSNDLIWALVRNNNSFLVKRNGVQFTKEPGNVMNKNSFKWSGLANSKTVSVVSKKGKAALRLKTRAAGNKPKNAFKEVNLFKGPVKGNATINKHVGGSFYRRDLERAALARFTNITKAAGGRKPRSKRVRKGRKN